MSKILLVAVGGAIGAVARYGIATWLTPDPIRPALPWGTIAVNLAGCFMIGLLMGSFDARSGVPEPARLFLMIGVLGGFTTFSAFGLETYSLLRSGAGSIATANVVLQVAGGLVGVGTGWAAGRFVAGTFGS